MNTSAATPFTPLESLFLLRGILSKGLSAAAFNNISRILSNNSFIREAPTYDARRLTPESLKGFFLQLLWEQLKAENEPAQAAPRPDGGLSPASKKRRLQPPAAPSLKDVRHHHLDKVVDIANRLEAEYRDHAIQAIREDETRYDQLQAEIVKLELEERDAAPIAPEGAPARQDASEGSTEPIKGRPTSGAQPSTPLTPQKDGTHRAASPLRSEPNGPGPTAPVQAQQPTAHSPQLSQPPVPVASTRPLEAAKPLIGTPVLQAPPGVPPFPPHPSPAGTQSPTLAAQRLDAAARPKQPAVPQPGQAAAAGQSQLSWQPPYQPPRQTVQHPGQRPLQPSPVPQRNQPAIVPPRPQVPPPQTQALPQTPQQPQSVLVPPQSAAQLSSQTTPSKSAAQLASGPGKSSPNQAGPLPEQGRLQPAVEQQQPASEATHRQGQFRPSLSQGQGAISQQLPDKPLFPGPVPHLVPSALSSADGRGRYSSPQNSLPPRTAIPPHLQSEPSPQPGRQGNKTLPSTPARQSSLSILTSGGSGTKWKSTQTPSTPRPSPTGAGDGAVESPAIEPLSPKRTFSSRAKATAPPSSKSRLPANQTPANDLSAASAPKRRGRPPRTTQPAASSSPAASKEDSIKEPYEAPAEPIVPSVSADKVKQEDTATPRPPTEAGDTTADESVAGKRHTSRLTKRKRRDSSPTPAQTPLQHQTSSLDGLPALPPTEVFWTRAFNKVSGSAMEQIVHHRSANMFAHPIREKDAPGYSKVILRPQDLKSIRAAITHGNKAASQAAAALPGGDPSTSTVRLAIGEELVPPRGIINSSQLDRELAHMFSNAIMYNPDPFHGPGPTYLRPDDDDDPDAVDGVTGENALGYKVDEFGVVKDARAMFVEVEKLVSELRSAEIQRARPVLTAGTSTRHASVAAGGIMEGSMPRDDEGSAIEDADEQTATEAESVGNPSKRRRTTRG